MNFNTILYRFGLEPNDFDNRPIDPVKSEDGFIYELWQKDNNRKCPYCGSERCHIHNYFFTETSCCINGQLKETLRIRKIRYICTACGKTFTNHVRGIDTNDTITRQVKEMIRNDFFKMMSFTEIAEKYSLSKMRIIQLFDEIIDYVPRKSLPRTLCIDEKRFSDGSGSKYICILYDYETGTVVDVLRSRQLAYLYEYFDGIGEKERKNVKYFVCDMNDGYMSVQKKYFSGSTLIIDLFHIIRQLTEAVNSIRILAMHKTTKSSVRYRFMKTCWRTFLCRKEDVPDRFMTDKKTGQTYHFDDLIFDCLVHDADLMKGYNILQDFYHYYQKRNYKDSLDFIQHISDRCRQSDNIHLTKAGETYYRYRYGIANTISKSQNIFHPSNSAAENTNNHIETLLRISYGFKDFERFRKRILLIRTYKNE